MKKPTVQTHILVEGRIVGVIMCDELGYFYRPRYNSISKTAYNSKKDGSRFLSFKDCKASIVDL